LWTTAWANEFDLAEAVALYAANHVRSLVGALVLTSSRSTWPAPTRSTWSQTTDCRRSGCR
jgi:hypothetical protein